MHPPPQGRIEDKRKVTQRGDCRCPHIQFSVRIQDEQDARAHAGSGRDAPEVWPHGQPSSQPRQPTIRNRRQPGDSERSLDAIDVVVPRLFGNEELEQTFSHCGGQPKPAAGSRTPG